MQSIGGKMAGQSGAAGLTYQVQLAWKEWRYRWRRAQWRRGVVHYPAGAILRLAGS